MSCFLPLQLAFFCVYVLRKDLGPILFLLYTADLSRSSWDSWVASASLCQWYADFWLLSVGRCKASDPRVCVYWWHWAMDPVAPQLAFFCVFVPRKDLGPILFLLYTADLNQSSWDSCVASASLCQWYADFWLLSSVRHCKTSDLHVCVYWWHWAMDPVQPVAAQQGKDGCSVVCVVSLAASDPRWTNDGGLGLCSARPVCSQSGYPFCLIPINGHAHHTNYFLLFCCSATNIHHQSIPVSQPAVLCSRSTCHWSFHGCTMVVHFSLSWTLHRVYLQI